MTLQKILSDLANLKNNPAILEIVAKNPNTPPEVLAELALHGTEEVRAAVLANTAYTSKFGQKGSDQNVGDNGGGGFEYSHSFTNDRGNEVTQYKISGGGYARVEKYSDGYVVTNIIIHESNRGKGHATNLYEKLNKESVKATGKTLQSIKPDENGDIELSSDGQRLWKSFEKKGLAKSIGNNRWRFKK